jgi:hypothetical protein
MVTRVVGRFVAAGAGTAALAYGVVLLAAHPGRPGWAWLAGGAALIGVGLALLDRQATTRALVANLGGAASLLAAGLTWLVVSIVTLAEGGDRAGRNAENSASRPADGKLMVVFSCCGSDLGSVL